MKNPTASRLRGEWVPRAAGDVLEVGVGSGLNLAFYNDQVQHVYGLDPSEELLAIARKRAAGFRLNIDFLHQKAEAGISLPSASVDTAILTWTLCSMDDPLAALVEIGRVMRRNARLIFVEHGRAPDRLVRTWQGRLTPLWKQLTGGCHLDRDIRDLIERGGFEFLELQTSYVPGPRPVTYTYRGLARRLR